jgi:hypothetical protein
MPEFITKFANGYGTVITGILMIASGVIEFVGIDLPWVEAGAAGMWVSNGFGLLFLKRAIAKTTPTE